MPIPRFRIRTLMIAVAVVGVVAWVAVTIQKLDPPQRSGSLAGITNQVLAAMGLYLVLRLGRTRR